MNCDSSSRRIANSVFPFVQQRKSAKKGVSLFLFSSLECAKEVGKEPYSWDLTGNGNTDVSCPEVVDSEQIYCFQLFASSGYSGQNGCCFCFDFQVLGT